MNMWKPKEETPAEQRERERRDQERKETHETLERLAGEEIGPVAALQAEWLRELKAEHEADCAGYSFDCKKYGGFLTLFMTRAANRPHPKRDAWGGFELEKDHVSTINLSSCRQIEMKKGRAPDFAGSLGFGFELSGRDNFGWSSNEDGNRRAPDGRNWVIVRPECPLAYRRPLFALAEPCVEHSVRGWCSDDDRYRIKARVSNSARGAVDDTIFFAGLTATLYTPAGMGQMVLDRILRELASEPVPKIEIKA